jgi:hypothetical protein
MNMPLLHILLMITIELEMIRSSSIDDAISDLERIEKIATGKKNTSKKS